MGIIEKIKKKLYKKPKIEKVAIFSPAETHFSMQGKNMHVNRNSCPCEYKKIYRYEDEGCDGR